MILVEPASLNQRNNVLEKQSIYKIDRSIPVGARLFQKKKNEDWNPPSYLFTLAKTNQMRRSPMMKCEKVSKKFETKELIKNFSKFPYCFTIQNRSRENSLVELFKRKSLMITLKHSFNSQPGIYQ
jgi:hypothetical protein